VVDHPSLPGSKKELLDAFAARITPRTRVVSVSHCSNVAGLIMPARELADMAHAVGAWFHLDAAQTYGWMQLDVAALDCDSLAGASQKWLMGPLGAGMLYVKPERIAELDPPVISHGYWNSGPRDAVTGQAFEQLGQSDDAKLVGYLAALDARAQIGEAQIERMVIERCQGLRKRLSAKGIEVGGSDDPTLWGPVLAVVAPGDVAKRRDTLWKQHKLACSPTAAGTVRALRISPHIYTSAADLDRVATLLS
jgi:isopenicillin-N epimerase